MLERSPREIDPVIDEADPAHDPMIPIATHYRETGRLPFLSRRSRRAQPCRPFWSPFFPHCLRMVVAFAHSVWLTVV